VRDTSSGFRQRWALTRHMPAPAGSSLRFTAFLSRYRSNLPLSESERRNSASDTPLRFEEEDFITSGNWRGKHNSLSRGVAPAQTRPRRREGDPRR
jgi:hypothetical protein